METYRLCVGGANSAVREGGSFTVPTITDLPLDEAERRADEWIGIWLNEGFTLATSGLYLRGSEWRRVAIYREWEKER